MQREIIHIDEAKCDGCGLCVPACAEGALRIVAGKARLVADRLCDGMGACLGHCPRGAIRIEPREADAFDEAAVAAHTGAAAPTATEVATSPPAACPGSRFARFEPKAAAANVPDSDTPASASQLTHWPVQLMLLPAESPVFHQARLLLAADCVPFAYADFHRRLLQGRTLAVGCPKLDDLGVYIDKLTAILRRHDLQSITVARMTVPCCMGLVHAVREGPAAGGHARAGVRSGRHAARRTAALQRPAHAGPERAATELLS